MTQHKKLFRLHNNRTDDTRHHCKTVKQSRPLCSVTAVEESLLIY